MSVFVVPKNLFRRTVSACSTQTPTLIGCNLLTIRTPAVEPLGVNPAAISEALNYDTVSCTLTQGSEEFSSNHWGKASCVLPPATRPGVEQKANPVPACSQRGGFQHKSLTMTYFHTGICTIIGAKSFHGPVRDGKEWDQLAMVVRHNGLLC